MATSMDTTSLDARLDSAEWLLSTPLEPAAGLPLQISHICAYAFHICKPAAPARAPCQAAAA